MRWLAIDIGGANLKLADGLGFAESFAFPLWKDSARLAQHLRTLISQAPASDHLAVTMTGELADCFATKADGVRFILNAVSEGTDNRHTRVYLVDGRIVSPQVAITVPKLAAASNWHVLARWAGRKAPSGSALLVDVGSTTCDIVPLVDGVPSAVGTTDTQRLLSGSLVYTGVERSPVCAVAQSAVYRGSKCPLTQELFATTRDVYLLLEKLPEDAVDLNTADGRPATRSFARNRLARMVAADSEEFNHRDAVELAQSIAESQSVMIARSILKVVSTMSAPPEKIIVSGHGDFLARQAIHLANLTAPQISLTEELTPRVSRCATAHALAIITRELSMK